MRRISQLAQDTTQRHQARLSMMGLLSVPKSFLNDAPKTHDCKAFKTKNKDPNNRGFSFGQSSAANNDPYYYN